MDKTVERLGGEDNVAVILHRDISIAALYASMPVSVTRYAAQLSRLGEN